MSAEPFPQTFSILLSPPHSGELSPVSDASFISSDEIKGCRVSTTVSDVRYGHYTDGMARDEGEAVGERRTSCIVFLKFGFANNLSRRIKEIEISVSFLPVQAPPTISSGGGSPGPSTVTPQVRLYEPSSGRSEATSVRITLERTATGTLGMNAGTTVGGGLSRSVETEGVFSAWLNSIQSGINAVIWSLEENSQQRRGVPPELNCAVVLRTDGMPFTASVQFEAKIRGTLGSYKGAKALLIDSSHLKKRQSALPPEEEDLLNNMDTDRFGEWVKTKAQNSWMVII